MNVATATARRSRASSTYRLSMRAQAVVGVDVDRDEDAERDGDDLHRSPMPSQRISSGISASDGIARLIWIGPSRSASPERVRPGEQRQDDADARCRRPRPRTARCGRDVQRFVLQPAVGDQVAGRGRPRSTAPTASAGRASRWPSRRSRSPAAAPGRAAAPNGIGVPGPSRRRRGDGRRPRPRAVRGPGERRWRVIWRLRLIASRGDGLEPQVVEVLGLGSPGCRSPWRAGRWSPGAARSRRPVGADVRVRRRCRPATDRPRSVRPWSFT